MADDLQACLKLYKSWKRKYKNEASADLKNQLEEEVQRMTDTFQTYRDALAERRDTFQLSGLSASGGLPPRGGQEMLSHF